MLDAVVVDAPGKQGIRVPLNSVAARQTPTRHQTPLRIALLCRPHLALMPLRLRMDSSSRMFLRRLLSSWGGRGGKGAKQGGAAAA